MRRAFAFQPRPAALVAASRFNSSSTPGTGKPLGKPAPYTDPDMTHFRATPTAHPLYSKTRDAPKAPAGEWQNPMQNEIWSQEEVMGVKQTHKPRQDMVDNIAFWGICVLRQGFDIISGYKFGHITPPKILRRVVFLETAAGIPGMVAGTLRHLRSLRRMKRDYGWIHTLLEEAENERMHMLVFSKKYNPGLFFRGAVLLTQGVFWNVFFFTYLLSPRLCHRFVGYLEEEAVRTYTHILEVIDDGKPEHAAVKKFASEKADEIAIRYWRLAPDATMKDVLLAVRRDEANHRDTNHTFANMQSGDVNPMIKH